MRVARKNSFQGPVRRGQLLAERARAVPMRTAYPQLARLDIELRFADRDTFSHSPQCHTLHPGAVAFFRFTCPCVGCDGDFDLAAIVAQAVAGAAGGSHELLAEGRLACTGTLVRFSGGPQPCQLGLSYRVTGQLQTTVRVLA